MEQKGACIAWGTTAAILSGSFLQIMASSAVSPALPAMRAEFSHVSVATVQLAMTLPSVFILCISFFIPGLLKRAPLKGILLTGMVLYLVGGVGGAFSGNLASLLVLRSVMGVGLGLFTPLLPILISQLFQGQKGTDMMGYLQSFNFLGGMVGTAIGGVLAAGNWRRVFWVYLFGIIALVLGGKYLGGTRPQVQPSAPAAQPAGKTVWASWGLGGVMMLHGVFLFKVPLAAGELFAGLGEQDPQKAGLAVAMLYGGSFLAGLLVGRLRRVLKDGVMPCGCLLLAASFLVLGRCGSEGDIFLGAALLGIGSGVFAPMLYAVVPEVIPRRAIPATMTILNAAMYLGMFLSPYASALVKGIGTDTWAFDFHVAFAYELFLTLGTAWLFWRKGRKARGH